MKPIEQSWSLNRKAGAVINNTSLTLYDKASSIKIQRGHDIVIEDYNDSTVRFFGGTVAQVSYVSLGVERQISLRAQDYTLLANRTSIRKSYSTTNG